MWGFIYICIRGDKEKNQDTNQPTHQDRKIPVLPTVHYNGNGFVSIIESTRVAAPAPKASCGGARYRGLQ